MGKVTTAGFENEDAARDSSDKATDTKIRMDSIIDCPVCRYWSERLETSRTYALSPSESIAEEKRLLAILRQHQVEGACVQRLPYLSELLTAPEDVRTN